MEEYPSLFYRTELLASKGDDSVVNFIKTFHKLFRRELTCPHSKVKAVLALYAPIIQILCIVLHIAWWYKYSSNGLGRYCHSDTAREILAW